jgi:hypothetical protein
VGKEAGVQDGNVKASCISGSETYRAAVSLGHSKINVARRTEIFEGGRRTLEILE